VVKAYNDLVNVIVEDQLDESADDHLWNVQVGDREYNETTMISALPLVAAGTLLKLTYDYGSTSYFSITFTGSEKESNNMNREDFPRRKPATTSVVTVLSPGGINLDETFPTFSEWAFGRKARGVHLNLFKAGRKRNNFGLQERGTAGVRHMIYFPESFDTLQEYLYSLDYASRLKYQNCADGPSYTWFSVVALSANPQPKMIEKYYHGCNRARGFIECLVVPHNPNLFDLTTIYPKVFALFSGTKKRTNIPRGWITYRNNRMTICSGSVQTIKSNAPKGTAWDGFNQHRPENDGCILHEVDIEIRSLQQLFGTAEGLLSTL